MAVKDALAEGVVLAVPCDAEAGALQAKLPAPDPGEEAADAQTPHMPSHSAPKRSIWPKSSGVRRSTSSSGSPE